MISVLNESSNSFVDRMAATGYIGIFVDSPFRQKGYYLRALARDEHRLFQPGPFAAPALSRADMDDVFIGEVTKPATLTGLPDDIDLVLSCLGISRQRDGLTFDQLGCQCNKNLTDLAQAAGGYF